MKIPFGILEGRSIHISEIDSGRSNVLCPYCERPLIAKKGRIKRHHFAHDGVGCVPHFASYFFGIAGKLPLKLPLSVFAEQKLSKIRTYFSNLQHQFQVAKEGNLAEEKTIPILKNKLLELSKSDKTGIVKEVLGQVERYLNFKIAPFPDFHLIRLESLPTKYTDGKRICSYQDLDNQKHEYFYSIIFEPFVKFLKKYHQQTHDYKELESKIMLFQKDLSYFKQFKLYFITVKADHELFYKIGLTSRAIENRLKEIKLNLKKYYLKVELIPLFQINGFAFLESFFKQKYEGKRKKIGKMTEYFSLSKSEVEKILKDFHLIKLKGIPQRNSPAWIDWVYFNFNGKIYGHQKKSVYIKNEKFILSSEEVKRLENLMIS